MPTKKKATKKKANSKSASAGLPTVLELEVVHGDITRVADADVYVAGHYIDVTPQFAEEALDEIISDESLRRDQSDWKNPDVLQLKRSRRVLHSLTIRGAIRGALGDVNLFPMAAWHAAKLDEDNGGPPDGGPRMIGIAGMGHMGTFGLSELRRLGQAVSGQVAKLPNRNRICCVLIGGGVGNLPVEQAVEGLVAGIAEGALETAPDRRLSLCIAERNIGRAHEIYRTAKARFTDGRVRLKGSGPLEGVGGAINESDSLILSLGSLAALANKPGASTTLRRALKPADSALGSRRDRIESIIEKLQSYGKDQASVIDALVRLSVTVKQDGASAAPAPTRLTCAREPDGRGRSILSFAALSSTAVVPKRYNPIDWDLVLDTTTSVEELGESDAPSPERVNEIAALLDKLLIPRDFRDYVRSPGETSLDAPLIFDLDRETAMVHWELLDANGGENEDYTPLATRRQVSRQLRTEYSSAPGARTPDGNKLSVLLIASPGNPDDPDEFLPGAISEVKALKKFFGSMKNLVQVDVLGDAGAPVKRLEVLNRLLSRKHYDILHYSGHASFDEKDPTKAGWWFRDGVLAASELQALDTVPQLVVANACLSAKTAKARRAKGTQRDNTLTPGLADEFFKRGVRAYVGTAWSIADDAAEQFANHFYSEILFKSTTSGNSRSRVPRAAFSSSIGDAMLEARKQLWSQRTTLGLAWAAYQHYGDPTLRINFPGARR